MDEISLDRTKWSNSSVKVVSSSGPLSYETGWAYDSRNQVIGGNIQDGSITFFNPRTGEWLVQKMNMQSAFGATSIGWIADTSHAVDFDTKDGVYIFIANGHTWAYRFR